jgi:hypothetical protein
VQLREPQGGWLQAVAGADICSEHWWCQGPPISRLAVTPSSCRSISRRHSRDLGLQKWECPLNEQMCCATLSGEHQSGYHTHRLSTLTSTTLPRVARLALPSWNSMSGVTTNRCARSVRLSWVCRNMDLLLACEGVERLRMLHAVGLPCSCSVRVWNWLCASADRHGADGATYQLTHIQDLVCARLRRRFRLVAVWRHYCLRLGSSARTNLQRQMHGRALTLGLLIPTSWSGSGIRWAAKTVVRHPGGTDVALQGPGIGKMGNSGAHANSVQVAMTD